MHKGTVEEIQAYTKEKFGYKAKSCWIADVKSQCNIPVKPAWNRKSLNERENQCPKDKIEQIEQALKDLSWL